MLSSRAARKYCAEWAIAGVSVWLTFSARKILSKLCKIVIVASVCTRFCAHSLLPKMNIRILLIVTLVGSRSLFGFTPEEVELFENKIRPVLAGTCYECHNSVNKTKAGLALDWSKPLLAGSDEGKVIVPGNPDESVLIWAIRHQDGYDMPDNGPKLDDFIIADFEEWVRMGAPDPRDKKPTELDLDNALPWPELLEKRSEWWSFQPLKKTRPPKVEDEEWNESFIDRFIYSELSAQGLEAQIEAWIFLERDDPRPGDKKTPITPSQ